MNRLQIRHSLTKSASHQLRICEQLRLIYDSIADLRDPGLKEMITEQLVDAMIMAKKMNKRLVYYKTQYNDGTGNNGANFVVLQNTKARRDMRQSRVG